ncbi:MAG: M20/M25/M40 family metallo-hydrolase [Myxococcota bacterium]|nr:M20/M25/M40 family metallo-hydrolase [Myxococcota bacterium]
MEGDGTKALAARILAEAIRIDTTNPPGDERPLAEYLVEVAREAGLESRVVPTPPPRGGSGEGPGRAAAWARLPGRGDGRPLVLLSHLDVVPADAAEWTLPPFAGIVAGGHVVGRGALDAKGVAVVHLLALAELARRDPPPRRDVIFLSVPDEETGGRDGAAWLTRERRDLLGDAAWLLGEGGGILAGVEGQPDVWGVTFTEKSPCWLELRARGPGGHGSTASPDAATHRLVEALARVREMDLPVRVVPEVARSFEALARLSPPEEAARLRDLRRSLAEVPAFRERFLADPGRAALVRDTVTITVLEAGGRTNVVPPVARAEIDARLLPGSRCDAFAERMRFTIGDPAVELHVMLAFPSRPSPVDTELFDAIARVAARRDPEAAVVPRVIPGFTDAHYFRELGLVAYGFVPRRLRPVETRSIHGPNERIDLDNLAFGVEVLVEIVRELDRIGPDR